MTPFLWEEFEDTEVPVTLPLKQWWRVLAAARHGEQDFDRRIREGDTRENVVEARDLWNAAIDQACIQVGDHMINHLEREDNDG